MLESLAKLSNIPDKTNAKQHKLESESYIFFANNMFTLLTCIISKNKVIVRIKFTCQP